MIFVSFDFATVSAERNIWERALFLSLEFEIVFIFIVDIHRQQSAWVDLIAQLEFQSPDESACHYGFHSYTTFVDVEIVDRYSFVFSVKRCIDVPIYIY
jgi:hypothetical protein